MNIRRRDLLKFASGAVISAGMPRIGSAAGDAGIYDLDRFGNARILHMTDTHAQLLPNHFREPSINLGVGTIQGRPPHLVGRAFLDYFKIEPGSANAHAFTCLDFERSAERYGNWAVSPTSRR